MQKIITTQVSPWHHNFIKRDFINKRPICNKRTKPISKESSSSDNFLQYKTEHIAYISHELRSPLTGIVCALDLLRRSQLTEDQHELLNAATQSADYLLELLNNLLDFSYAEATQRHLNLEEVDLLALLDQTIQPIYLKAWRKKLRLHVIVMPDVPKFIKTSSLSFRQILVNLLTNAVKFTDQGQVTMTVCYRHGQLNINVRDTGCGVGEEFKEKIFHPYVKEHGGVLGSGLGLSIAARLAKMMGGDIRLDSLPTQGTSFTFSLPQRSDNGKNCHLQGTLVAPLDLHTQLSLWGVRATVGDNPDFAAPELVCMPGRLWKILTSTKYITCLNLMSSSPQINFPHTKNNKTETLAMEVASNWNFNILVVDDIEINRELIRKMLEQLGNRCVLAANGHEALQRGREEVFDLVFMDLCMPKLDGLETVALWRSKEQNVLDPECPIIGLTSSLPTKGSKQLACEMGMNYCLTRPVNLDKLSAAMRLVEIVQHTRELEEKEELLADSPLLDSYDKEIREKINSALSILYQELIVAHQQHDKSTLQDKMHVLKGLFGQAGFLNAAKKIEHMENILLSGLWPDTNDLYFLKTFICSDI